MKTRDSWVRWALLANGVAVALLGATTLVVELLLPRIGGDPMLAQPHFWVRPVIAALFVVTGTAHVITGALRRRLGDGVLVPLTATGMMSFVPTSIVLGLITLVALLREGEGRT